MRQRLAAIFLGVTPSFRFNIFWTFSATVLVTLLFHKVIYLVPIYFFSVKYVRQFGNFISDIIHLMLHSFLRSNFKLLNKIGSMHSAHHAFFTNELTHDDSMTFPNLFGHLVFEVIGICAGICLCYFIVGPVPVVVTLYVELRDFASRLVREFRTNKIGKDGHHLELEKIKAYQPVLAIGPDYHAMHHVYINAYYGSAQRWIDYLCGSGCAVKERSIAVTVGPNGLGQAMLEQLQNHGTKSIVTIPCGNETTLPDDTTLKSLLDDCEVLILCHNSDADKSYVSYLKIMEIFSNFGQFGIAPKEVWAIGKERLGENRQTSEITFQTCADFHYKNTKFHYRHIVQLEQSPNASGLDQAQIAARAISLVKRGFFYVPLEFSLNAIAAYRRTYKRNVALLAERQEGLQTASRTDQAA